MSGPVGREAERFRAEMNFHGGINPFEPAAV